MTALYFVFLLEKPQVIRKLLLFLRNVDKLTISCFGRNLEELSSSVLRKTVEIIALICALLTHQLVLWCIFRPNRSGWRLDRDMGLMNAIGLQPRHPAPSVTSQGTQTPIIQLQNAETQTERDLSEPSVSQPPLSTESLPYLHCDGSNTQYWHYQIL